jgi:hypothetical protein
MVGLKCYNKGGFKSILYYFKMNYRKKIGLLLFSTILLYFLGVALDASELLGICGERDITCRNTFDSVGEPLKIFFFFSIFPIIFLFFTKKSILDMLIVFCFFYIPISFIVIFSTPSDCSAPLNLCFSRNIVTFLLSIFLVIISLLIIIIKSWKLRERAKKSNEYEERREKIDTFTINKSKMDFSDTELIKQAIVSAEGNKNDKEIKETLLQQGFQEKDITKAFDEIKKEETNKK